MSTRLAHVHASRTSFSHGYDETLLQSLRWGGGTSTESRLQFGTWVTGYGWPTHATVMYAGEDLRGSNASVR